MGKLVVWSFYEVQDILNGMSIIFILPSVYDCEHLYMGGQIRFVACLPFKTHCLTPLD